MSHSLQSFEISLKTALEAYFDAVVSQKTDQPQDLMPSILKLDELSAHLPSTLHPQLKHYLQNKSYRKAYDFLQGESNIEKGSCGK